MEKPKKKRAKAFIVAMLAVAALLIYALVETNNFRVTRFALADEKISDSVKIVLLSDQHEKTFGADNARLFAAVRNERPDLIALGGDFIMNSYTKTPDTAYIEEFTALCSAIAPTYFVTGNHDRYHPDAVKQAVRAGGGVVLEGEIVSVQVGETQIRLGGIDDATIDKNAAKEIAFEQTGPITYCLPTTPSFLTGC